MRAIRLRDERTVHVDDSGPTGSGPDDPDAPVVVWHHETPHTGVHLAPVLDAAAARASASSR